MEDIVCYVCPLCGQETMLKRKWPITIATTGKGLLVDVYDCIYCNKTMILYDEAKGVVDILK